MRKSNSYACDNYRGISLLFIPVKSLARLINHLERGILRDSQ